LTHNATINDVVLEVESDLFSYLATRALRDAEITAVAESRADTAAAEARLRVGVGTLQDVLQTRTALAQARFQLETLEGTLLSSRGTLAAAMGPSRPPPPPCRALRHPDRRCDRHGGGGGRDGRHADQSGDHAASRPGGGSRRGRCAGAGNTHRAFSGLSRPVAA